MSSSVWTHAHSIVVQDPSWSVVHFGPSATVTPSGSGADLENWVHFAIPIFTEGQNTGNTVTGVSLRFSIGNQAHVTAINVWDGDIFEANPTGGDLPISNEPTAVTHYWGVSPNTTFLQYGLGISVQVKFDGAGQTASGAWVTFNAAGAFFTISEN